MISDRSGKTLMLIGFGILSAWFVLPWFGVLPNSLLIGAVGLALVIGGMIIRNRAGLTPRRPDGPYDP